MKKPILIMIAAGVLTAGSVALASNSDVETIESEAQVTMEQAKEIVLQEVDGKIMSAQLDEDNGKKYYEIDIYDGTTEYEFDIDATTGDIIELDKDIKKEKTSQKTGEVMTEDEALAIAREKAPNASVKEMELEEDKGWNVYDIELIDGNTKYEFDIDAISGEIIEFKIEEKQSKKNKDTNKEAIELTPVEEQEKQDKQDTNVQHADTLTMDEAIAIARKHATGTVTDIERDDGVFEIDMEDGDIEYEIEIDIHTGEIVSFEKDLD